MAIHSRRRLASAGALHRRRAARRRVRILKLALLDDRNHECELPHGEYDDDLELDGHSRDAHPDGAPQAQDDAREHDHDHEHDVGDQWRRQHRPATRPGQHTARARRPPAGHRLREYDLCAGQCSGAVPQSLRRPLHLPHGCRASGGSSPVGLSGTPDVHVTAFIGSPWKAARVEWVASGSYRGPVLIRGARTDGSGAVGFRRGPRARGRAPAAAVRPAGAEAGRRRARVAVLHPRPGGRLLRLPDRRHELQSGDHVPRPLRDRRPADCSVWRSRPGSAQAPHRTTARPRPPQLGRSSPRSARGGPAPSRRDVALSDGRRAGDAVICANGHNPSQSRSCGSSPAAATGC